MYTLYRFLRTTVHVTTAAACIYLIIGFGTTLTLPRSSSKHQIKPQNRLDYCCTGIENKYFSIFFDIRYVNSSVLRLKTNLNASKSSELSKGLGGNIGGRDKALHGIKAFPNVVT